MRTSILISTISAALLAGTAMLSAQTAPSPDTKANPSTAPNAQMSPGPAGAQDKSKAKGAEDKSKDKPSSAQGRNDKETTGQGGGPQQGAQPRSAPGAQPGQGPQAPRTQGPSGPETQGQAGAGAAGGASVNLTAEQRSQIRTTVLQSGGAPKVSNPTFAITVGTVVPRTVTVVEVPPTLVRINSAWRGHHYFIVGDRIIIVDRNFRIVAVLTV